MLFRIHAAHKTEDDARGVISVRINGDIYDVVGSRAVNAFEMPRREFNAPYDCDTLCKLELVGQHAAGMGESLGNVVANMLANYYDDSVGDSRRDGTRSGGTTGGSDEAVSGDRTGTDSGSARREGQGMVTDYTVTLKNFSRIVGVTIERVMAEEFPFYRSHDIMSQAPGLRKYSYNTSAKMHKLEEWFTILLHDMGYNVDREVAFLIRGTHIEITKIGTTHDRPQSEDEKNRFN